MGVLSYLIFLKTEICIFIDDCKLNDSIHIDACFSHW